MKRLLLFLLLFMSLSAMAQQNPKPFVIPELTSWQGSEGTLSPSMRIAVKGADKELQRIANLFAQDYLALTGRNLTIVKGSGKAGDIVLQIDKKATSLGKEGYELDINTQAVV
ncbi:MAG: beta-N-acetylhexosaminidase, partial [Alistipes sp.]|nr:beta-N-acetylhexosaminidase [Alistipes sp.]